MEVVTSKAADEAETEEEKLEVENAESSSDSDDDSGDDTASEVERKPVGAPTPVLFQSKKSNANTTSGGQLEDGSSSSSSDSDSDSDDDEDDDKVDIGKLHSSTAIEPVVEVQDSVDGASNMRYVSTIASKLIESNEEAGGSDEKIKSIKVLRSPGGDSCGDNDIDADDVLKFTTTVNPITDIATTDMPFTQELSSFDIQRDSESASDADESNMGSSADESDNLSEDLAHPDKISANDGEIRKIKNVAHSGQIEKKKTKLKNKESVDTTPKVAMKAIGDSDSESSSSSDDDDSDEESSVDYLPAPKKPPLALMVRHHVCVRICMYVGMHLCMCICIFACMYVCKSVCISVCVCMHICMYVLYMCLFFCTNMHI